MNTVQKMILLQKNIVAFIQKNLQTTDYLLKNVFVKEQKVFFEDTGLELYEVIDEAIHENKIERFYPEDSQVAFYRIC